MKMKICDVIEKIRDIDRAIAAIAVCDDDNETAVDLLEEYKDKLLSTTVDI